jgi:hypothetical protein
VSDWAIIGFSILGFILGWCLCTLMKPLQRHLSAIDREHHLERRRIRETIKRQRKEAERQRAQREAYRRRRKL